MSSSHWRATSDNDWAKRYGYCRAVRAGHLAVTTGTVPMNPDGTPYTPNNGYEQALRAYEIIEKALADVGAAKADIVRTRMYVTDIALADDFGSAHKAFFADHTPCLTMVEVSALVAPEFLIEIEAEAYVA
ncbi:MAG: hypothetical protein DHS20C14_21730 [Phycisphaeraceae bacterium]|nr:MAG: hypothetical protein DHS20C14_21730 [Phycisphaeraceae bacterium]